MYKYILFIIVTYIYLYNPVFRILPNMDTLMLLYPLVFLCLKQKYKCELRLYKNILNYWFIIFLYIIIIVFFSGASFKFSWFGYLIETIIITIILSKILIKNNISIVKLLLLTSSIAASISCFCLIIPKFDTIIRAIQIDYSVLSTEVIFRSFGLAQGLNFEYGIIQGLIFGIGLFNIENNKWYVIFMPLVIISILINARTGIIVVALAVGFYTLHKKNYKVILMVVVSLYLLFLGYQYLENLMPYETFIWMDTFFQELIDVFGGTDNARTNTVGTLIDMLIWPKDLFSWIFGTGNSFFGNESGPKSDIGYINQLAYGGLIYLFMILQFSYLTIKKGGIYMDKMLFIFIITSFLVANFKGSVLANNGGAFKVAALFSFTLYQMRNTPRSFLF